MSGNGFPASVMAHTALKLKEHGHAQSKPARGERKVFSVDAQRQLWAAAASSAASGFPGGSDAYVQVRRRDSNSRAHLHAAVDITSSVLALFAVSARRRVIFKAMHQSLLSDQVRIVKPRVVGCK